MRRLQRSIYEEARDVARALAKTDAFERSRRDRKRIEILFAHLKRIFGLGRLPVLAQLRAQGLKLHHYSARDIAMLADDYLIQHWARLISEAEQIVATSS